MMAAVADSCSSSMPSSRFLEVERAVDTDDDLSDWDGPIEVDLLDPPLPRNKVGSW